MGNLRGNRNSLCSLALLAIVVLTAAFGSASESNDINVRAERIAREHLARLGEGYTAKIDRQRHLIYISGLDQEHLAETTKLLAAFHDAFRHTMGSRAPKWNITIVLPTAQDFRKLVPEERCAGRYYARGRKLVAIDRGETLMHEFTHALHDADTGGRPHPMWVAEGLATLFQSSEVTPSGLAPYVDARVRTLQEAIYQKRTIPLEKLFKMGSKEFSREAELAYAQSRYVMYYLCERNRLRGFYRRLKETAGKDPYGIRAFENALTGSLPSIEKEWQGWALKLRPPSDLYLKYLPVLGLKVAPHDDGVEITALDDDGAAERTGRLRVGDVILKFNGLDVGKPKDLYAALRACRAAQTVEIEILRHGRPMTVYQPLEGPKQKS